MKTDRAAARQTHRRASRPVVSRRQIAERVESLAQRITEVYRGKELTVLAVLTGSVVFLADLIRRLAIPVRLEVAQVSSYPQEATSSRGMRFTLPLTASLAGRHVLILDDILDSGRTLSALVRKVESLRPASIRTCVLLRKRRADLPDRPEPDFLGFEVPNEFVVGYGLDFNNLYRNLPDVRVLERAAACADAGAREKS
ncbi:MAG TPA: hypoxanthine phosphoribosyltransferase [Phycisphaerae bacterium]|nr:hypoxanthine phosphoribosyltransferase [Phycisphaerae bacterium]